MVNENNGLQPTTTTATTITKGKQRTHSKHQAQHCMGCERSRRGWGGGEKQCSHLSVCSWNSGIFHKPRVLELDAGLERVVIERLGLSNNEGVGEEEEVPLCPLRLDAKARALTDKQALMLALLTHAHT